MNVYLETERLLLKRLTPEDVDVFAELNGDPDVMRFLNGGKPIPRAEVENRVLPSYLAYYERYEEFGYWAAIEKSTGDFVGWFALHPPLGHDPADAELGYRLRRSSWGKGYATEGSRALIHKGFSELGVQQVRADTMVVNTASRRILEKVGVRLVRVFYQDWPDVIEGSEQGDVEYALHRAEWEQSLSNPDLLALHIDALFTHDSQGRMRSINEPDGEQAPHVYLGRTRQGNSWRFRHDLPDEVVRRLEALAAGEPLSDDLRTQTQILEACLGILREHNEPPRIESGPAYRFPADLPAPVGVTRITASNVHLIQRMGSDWESFDRELEARLPCYAVVEGGDAASVCFSSRLTAGAAEAGVETLERHRGRGYAVAVVAAWARDVRSGGRVPLYSTAWENVASRAVARGLGLVRYGSDFSIM